MAGGTSPSTGYKSTAAFAIEESVHGIAKVLGSGDAIHIVSAAADESPLYIQEPLIPENVPRLYGRHFEGNISIEGHYGEIALLAAALGGSHENVSPKSLGSGAYQHWFEPDWNLADRAVSVWESASPSGKKLRRRGTLCLWRGGNLWQLDGVMVTRFELKAESGGKGWMNFDFTGRGKTLNPAGQSVANWTFPTASTIYFDGLKVYVWGRDKFTLSGSKTITWSNAGGSASATLTDKTYYALELAEEIAAQMTAQNLLAELYSAGYDHAARRFWIASDTPFQITGSGTINPIIGFAASASRKLRQESDYAAAPDDIPYYAATDLLNITELNVTMRNDLSIEQMPEKNFPPFAVSGKPSSIGGSFKAPRYEVGGYNVTIFDQMREGEPFCMKIEFTGALIGGGYYEKLDMLFPTVIFRSSVPVNPGIVSPQVSFTAHFPERLDLRNMGIPEYRFGTITKTGTDVFISVGVYKDELIVGSDALRVYRIKDNDATFEQIGSPTSDPTCYKSWNGYLSIGCSDGEMYRWNGASFTLAYEFVSGVADLEFYEGKIYALLGNGDVYSSSDGLSWSLSYDGSATGFRLKAAFGKLYALIAGKVRQYDGSSWSQAYDFANTPSNMSICLMGEAVYATSDAKIAKNTGVGFSNLGTLGITPKHIEGFLGNVILLEAGATKDIYYLNERGVSAVAIDNTFNQTFQYKPVVFNNRLVIPITATASLKYFKAREALFSVINRTSTNPLF